VTYAESLFVAVGAAGTILTSSDGTTWTSRTSGTTSNLYDVTYGNNRFVAVGGLVHDAGPSTTLTSLDGLTWTGQTVSGYYLVGVTYGNRLFVAAGTGFIFPCIYTSPDGVTLTKQSVGGNGSGEDVAYGNNVYVALVWLSGGLAYIFTSPDGSTWTQKSLTTLCWLNGVTYCNGLFVAVGGYNSPYSGVIVTSPDGSTWTQQKSGTTNSLNGVTYGDSLFVAVGSNGTILTSKVGGNTGVINTGFSKAVNTRLSIHVVNNHIVATVPDRVGLSEVNAEIFNVAGKKVYSASTRPDNGILYLQANGLPPGIYILSIIGNKTKVSTSFFIAK
jgi:hypothetical protein